MKNVLWVSLMLPYDTVSHASGKTQNWYLKQLIKTEGLMVRLASFCKPDEIEKLDLKEYGINYNLYVRPRGGIINETKRVIAWVSKLVIWNKYAGLTTLDYRIGIKKILNELRTEGYKPNIIILQWTEILFFLPLLKNEWPDAKFVAIEEDVSYLGLQRKRDYYNNPLQKLFFSLKEKKVKKTEIALLNECNLTVFNNEKDYKLAKNDGFVEKN